MLKIVLSLTLLFLSGCQAGTRPPQAVSIPQPGQTQIFVIKIYDYTQQDILISVPGSSQGILIHAGGWVSFDLGFLPYGFTVSAATTILPVQQLPDQTFLLGRNYSAAQNEVDVYYY